MKISSSSLLVLLFIFVVNEAELSRGLRRVRHKSREQCQVIPDSGSCTATLRRWYYDSETGDCKTFIWGGCGGNDNRFRSRRQCERRCIVRGSTASPEDRMSTYFRAVSRSGRRCPRLRCGDHGSSCLAGTSPVFSTDDAGCPICTCRQLVSFLRPRTSCPPLDCSHLVCVGPVRFSSRLVGHCPVCECVAIDDVTASASAEESSTTVMTQRCPALDCLSSANHFRCYGDRKRDPVTGCETCECAEVDCSDCAAVCAGFTSSDCAAACRCDVVNQSSCSQFPVDCEQRVGCVRSMNIDGCEICQCAVADIPPTSTRKSACPPLACFLECAMSGYAVDDNGCRVCACVSQKTTTMMMSATTTTQLCVPMDCASVCSGDFKASKGDEGCDVCICTTPETVTNSHDDVTKPTCVCQLTGSCDCQSGEAYDQRNEVAVDVQTAKWSECEPVMTCGDICMITSDDAGCQVCLCNEGLKTTTETETEFTAKQSSVTPMFSENYDDATTMKYADDVCEHQFICHPICHEIKDLRGCVVECRCDNGMDTLTSMQQQQQQQQQLDAMVESQVPCPTAASRCSCDDNNEEELWTVTDDGCPTCVCLRQSTLQPPTTTITIEPTTTLQPSTTETTKTTTKKTTASVTTTETVSDHDESSATTATALVSNVTVACRRLKDGDCAGVNCGSAGYAKDQHGCDVCSCAGKVVVKKPVKTVNHVVAAARKGACSLSPLRGPCRADIVRWYYDVSSGTCDAFSYGGCRGNANNFRSAESCSRYCQPQVDERERQSRMWYQRVLGLLRH